MVHHLLPLVPLAPPSTSSSATSAPPGLSAAAQKTLKIGDMRDERGQERQWLRYEPWPGPGGRVRGLDSVGRV